MQNDKTIWLGNVLIGGARLCEPQHVALPITLLRVTDPRSESKFGRCLLVTRLDLFLHSSFCLLPLT